MMLRTFKTEPKVYAAPFLFSGKFYLDFVNLQVGIPTTLTILLLWLTVLYECQHYSAIFIKVLDMQIKHGQHIHKLGKTK